MKMFWNKIKLLIFSFSYILGYCPDGGYHDPVTSKCFLFSNSKTDWFTAKHSCELKGAFLAKVESQLEMDFMASVKPNAYYWMGINDLEIEDEFRWLDESQVSWFGWKSNQPNGGSTQNCTTIDNKWEWQDKECENDYYFVCNPIQDQKQYGSWKLDSISDIRSMSLSYRVSDRVDCASRCISEVQCAYWGYSSSSSSSNCKLFRYSPGSTYSFQSSWDYYKMEWIQTINNTYSR